MKITCRYRKFWSLEHERRIEEQSDRRHKSSGGQTENELGTDKRTMEAMREDLYPAVNKIKFEKDE